MPHNRPKIKLEGIKLLRFFIAACLIITSLLAVIAQPQPTSALRLVDNYVYTKAIGGTASDAGRAVVTDSSGNVYLSGRYDGTVDFDPDGAGDTHVSNGINDIFLTKINADGSYGYTRTMGGSGDDFSYGVTVDSSDNVYVVGQFASTVDFDPDGAGDSHISAGNLDMFLTKINADGSYGYTKSIGGTGNEIGRAVVIDYLDNIYIAGSFASTVDFDPDGAGDSHTNNGSNDIFLTKINADGSYGYTRSIGGTGADIGFCLAVDPSGNPYVCGQFANTVDFDPDGAGDSHISGGGMDIFLTKINADGSYGYTRTIGDITADIAIVNDTDSSGNVYMSGRFNGTVDFDPDGAGDTKVSNGGNDIFLTKINADGSYGYTKSIGGTGSDVGQAISKDSLDNIYFGGAFNDTVDFDPDGAGDSHVSNGGNDVFLTKINADGSYGYTKTFGAAGSDAANSIFSDSNNLYVIGAFNDTVDFDPDGAGDSHVSNGGNDIFLTKYSHAVYHHINDLPAGLAATTLAGTSIDDETIDDGIEQGDTITIRVSDTSGIPIADVVTTFNADLDWSTISGASDTGLKKSFVNNLVSAPGTAGTYTLYVPYGEGDNAVVICPNATTLDEISTDCTDSITYTLFDDNIDIVTINSVQYWQVSDLSLSGSGGISTIVSAGDTELADTGYNGSLTIIVAVAMIVSGTLGTIMFKKNLAIRFR